MADVPLVQNGVMRVASQSTYPNRLGTARAVREVLQAFCADPRHEFLRRRHLARLDLLTPSRVTDIYLLALAHHHQAFLATFDRRIPTEAVRDGPAAIALIDA